MLTHPPAERLANSPYAQKLWETRDRDTKSRFQCLLLFRVFLAALVALAPVAALAAEPEIPNFWDTKRRLEKPALANRSTIRFLTADDFPPFNFIDSTGTLTGFNVDLARAVCAELEVACTIQARPFAELATSLEAGDGDAVIAGLSTDHADHTQLDFSEIYLRLPARFAARKADADLDPTPEGLSGRAIAVVANTAHAAFLTAFFPDSKTDLYPDQAAARAALRDGNASLMFGDGMSLSFWLGSGDAADCCVLVGGPYTERRYFGEGFSIAVKRGDVNLRNQLNYALQRVYQKGAYGELYLRYFPIGFF